MGKWGNVQPPPYVTQQYNMENYSHQSPSRRNPLKCKIHFDVKSFTNLNFCWKNKNNDSNLLFILFFLMIIIIMDHLTTTIIIITITVFVIFIFTTTTTTIVCHWFCNIYFQLKESVSKTQARILPVNFIFIIILVLLLAGQGIAGVNSNYHLFIPHSELMLCSLQPHLILSTLPLHITVNATDSNKMEFICRKKKKPFL